MSLTAAILLLTSMQSAVDTPPAAPPSPPVQWRIETAAKVAKCGIDPGEIRYKSDRYEPDYWTVDVGGPLSDEQLRCLYGGGTNAIPVEFEDRELKERYFQIAAADARQQAKDWLDKRGFLEKLYPLPKNASSLAYAQKAERACGFRKGEVIKSWAEGYTFKPQQVKPGDERFICIFNAIIITGSSVGFGFVGNEAVEAPTSTR